jgi:hypothetical protein
MGNIIHNAELESKRLSGTLRGDTREADAEVPTFLDFLLTKSSPGEN